MSTEVQLMADVKDLGAEGEIVTVSDGFARNYLIPRKLAAPATEASKRRLAKMRGERESKRAAEVAAAREMAKRLEKVSCTITVKTGEDDKLFGSVTASHIADVLKAQGIELEKHSLLLEAPIRELGVYDVKVKLSADVEGSVKVWVVQE